MTTSLWYLEPLSLSERDKEFIRARRFMDYIFLSSFAIPMKYLYERSTKVEDLIKALQILLKYGNPEYPTTCGDGILFICGIDPEDVSNEDVEELEELGFIVRKRGFISYKFGTC